MDSSLSQTSGITKMLVGVLFLGIAAACFLLCEYGDLSYYASAGMPGGGVEGTRNATMGFFYVGLMSLAVGLACTQQLCSHWLYQCLFGMVVVGVWVGFFNHYSMSEPSLSVHRHWMAGLFLAPVCLYFGFISFIAMKEAIGDKPYVKMLLTGAAFLALSAACYRYCGSDILIYYTNFRHPRSVPDELRAAAPAVFYAGIVTLTCGLGFGLACLRLCCDHWLYKRFFALLVVGIWCGVFVYLLTFTFGQKTSPLANVCWFATLVLAPVCLYHGLIAEIERKNSV